MPTSAFHHWGLQVADLERAVVFYEEAFGARRLTRPITIPADNASIVMSGPAGTNVRFCILGLDDGYVELFEFPGPVAPEWTSRPTTGNLPHFGMQVDDVAASLERLERAGGKRIWPEVMQWGAAEVIYCADPDGNVVELTDTPLDRIVELTLEMFPDAKL